MHHQHSPLPLSVPPANAATLLLLFTVTSPFPNPTSLRPFPPLPNNNNSFIGQPVASRRTAHYVASRLLSPFFHFMHTPSSIPTHILHMISHRITTFLGRGDKLRSMDSWRCSCAISRNPGVVGGSINRVNGTC